MNRAARNVLRKIGTDVHLEEEREEHVAREMDEARSRGQQAEEEARKRPGHDEGGMSNVPEELLTDSEKRHELYRRRQSMASRTESAAERLPIMTSEERKARDRNRPKYHATEFEGPIEKLIEKYQDLDEVLRHLTLGQSMKYEFTEDGCILDRDGNMIYDGEKIVGPQKK
ncbi:MAG: hypothetical protein CME13_05445 [Gemmatimonadetes bacterium]|jgi:hypothetical protein|nr:hypothetical protein [Gemmatimonadota bacterium]MDP7634651.1 hypothetical protein [Candidatus Latescibacterota bacterium]HCV24754.1 hypothetical protein [Candidatus Latescibacterota bacterium]|tara:strand:- start:791 stop:1303 length:513 start_codon:yes stop_codon:yes gene_type:complete